MLIILWVIIHGMLFWHFGIRILYDSADYIQRADFLIAHGVFRELDQIFYAVPAIFISLFRWVFPQQIFPFLIFQIVLSGGAVLALYRSAEKVFSSPTAGFLSGVIFLIWWDNIHWNTTVMTESLLCSATCLIIYQLVHFKGSRQEHYFIIGSLIFLFFIRPTSLVIILGGVAFLLRYHWHYLSGNRIRKFSLITGLLIIICFSANLMLAHWDFSDQHKRGNIVSYVDTIEGSPLYEESLRVNVNDLEFGPVDQPALLKLCYFVVHNPLHFIRTASLKIWYLVSGVRPYYSTIHNAYVFTWMIVIYLFCYFGWRSAKSALINTFIFTAVVLNCGLIGIFTIDWDNRFYIPMEPGIVLLAGGGAMTLINIFTSKKVKTDF